MYCTKWPPTPALRTCSCLEAQLGLAFPPGNQWRAKVSVRPSANLPDTFVQIRNGSPLGKTSDKMGYPGVEEWRHIPLGFPQKSELELALVAPPPGQGTCVRHPTRSCVPVNNCPGSQPRLLEGMAQMDKQPKSKEGCQSGSPQSFAGTMRKGCGIGISGNLTQSYKPTWLYTCQFLCALTMVYLLLPNCIKFRG